MTTITTWITWYRIIVLDGLLMLWRTRRGPCLHPAYCRQEPPGQRWSAPAPVVAAARLVLLVSGAAILLGAVTILSWWLAWLVLEFA